MTFRSHNVAMLRGLLKRILGEPARTGRFKDDGTIDPDPTVDGNPNFLWVRIKGNRAAVPAKNVGRMIVNASYTDVPVRVALNGGGELEIMSGDATEADKNLGLAAGTILSAQLINEVARFIVTGRNMLPARVRVWITGTLTVNSETWVYRNTANDRITWIPTDDNSLDLTSSLPAQVLGVDQKAPCIIALYADATAPALVALVGTPIDAESDLTLDMYDAIFVPDTHYPLSGAALTSSMTTLAESDFIDVREWLDRGVGLAGAPADATYILQTADGDLPNGQALDILATGLMLNTTATGVVSIATPGTDYTSPTGTESLTNKTITSPAGTFTDLALAAATTLTIASGIVTRTQTFHLISPQTGTSDDLDTINGGTAGKLMVIRPTSGNTINLTTAGNIVNPTGATLVLDQTYKAVWLIYDGGLSKWIVIGGSGGAGGGSMSTWLVAGDSGSPQTINDGQTLTVVGGTGIDTVAGATRQITINIDSTVVTLTGSQILTNKTLTTPTIGSFVNATHNHSNAAGGGTLDAAAIASGVLANARVNFASPDPFGATTPNTIKGTTGELTGAFKAGSTAEFDDKVGIGVVPGSMNASALVQIDSTTKGFAPPRMSTVQRDAISSPLEGLVIYNTTTHGFEVYNGTLWVAALTPDASVVTYTPAAGSDPGNVDGALDNLRSRVVTIEGGGILPGAGAPPSIFEARLGTSVSDTPTGDVSAATTLALNRHHGSQLGLFVSGAWALRTLPTGGSTPTISLSGDTIHTCYDLFVYDNSGVPTLEKLAWIAPASGAITGVTNANPPVVTSNAHGRSVNDLVFIAGVVGATGVNGLSRISAVTANTFTLQTLAAANPGAPGAYTSGGTWTLAFANSTRATALTWQDGILVKNGSADRRFVGSYRIGSTAGQVDDSVSYRGVSNFYNQIVKLMIGFGTGGTGTIPSSAGVFQEHLNNYAYRGYGICCFSENRAVRISATVRRTPTSAGSMVIQAAFNGSGSNDAVHATNTDFNIMDIGMGTPITGLNRIATNEYSLSGISTVFGQNNYAQAEWPC